MNYADRIAAQLGIRPAQTAAAIDLLDSGNTIPFLARYRKEATGSLDEEQLREIATLLDKLRSIDERRERIILAIGEQNQLTPELLKKLRAVTQLTELEDLYQPYKKKRKTRADAARLKGLEPLARLILEQVRTVQSVNAMVEPFLNNEVTSLDDALAGARDIVAEFISNHADVRQRTRAKMVSWSLLRCQKVEKVKDPRGVFRLYYEFEYRVDRLQPHQILAINRGEAEKILRVQIVTAERDWLLPMRTVFRPAYRSSPLAQQLQMAMNDAARRLLLPAMEREIRRSLTENAELHAIQVFASNLRGLLSQPPLSGHQVLAIDPAYRTGCKVAVVDMTGKVLDTSTIYPHKPQGRWEDALKSLARLIDRHGVTLIAIGNGTASRETERLAAELTRKLDSVHYLLVNEAGASVYSASKLARKELPELDVTLRGAVSIARRVQDPLAEYVKIDPKSIGVGLYQHDVNQGQLSKALTHVVESVVNSVGVDVNTASPALLTYVSGIGPKLAERIVAHRDKQGRFDNRQMLMNVYGLGNKVFEQCAGFLRIPDGDNPLDASAIHPESYEVASAILRMAGIKPGTGPSQKEDRLTKFMSQTPVSDLARQVNSGVPTVEDILEQLMRPGRDPRQKLPPPILRDDILAMADLEPGMAMTGTVRNVVDFGAFIDIGVKQDGLLHKSQIPRGHLLQVGDIIQVRVLKIDEDRGRISLGWPVKT